MLIHTYDVGKFLRIRQPSPPITPQYFCEHQACIARLIHKAAGHEFKGFTHHDCGVRYLSGYMQLAYKKSTPQPIQQMYHLLACHPIKGPKLRIPIPESLRIENPDPMLPAIDRIKNYDKVDIDMSLLGHMDSQTFVPSQEDGNDDADESWDYFSQQCDVLQNGISQGAEVMFDICLANSTIPKAAKVGVRTRDLLKQLWEESCYEADNLGDDGVKKLEENLLNFRLWSNDQSKVTSSNDADEGVGRIVPMTQGRFKGTAKRIHNTFHMH